MGRRVIAGLAALGLAWTMGMAPAAADPKGETFELVCDNGKTYTIVTTEVRASSRLPSTPRATASSYPCHLEISSSGTRRAR